ncbi:hypothetical protein HKD37_08G023133 [Glycine soja]
MTTNDYYVPHIEPTEFVTHISSYTQLLGGSSKYCEMSPQLNESSQLNVDSITDIHVTQSESNEMSHDYHAQNGLSDEVVGDFSDDEDKILVDNNNNNNNDNDNDNDDNDIQFLFQQTSIKNVYRPYPNSTDVGDNQVLDNPDYRHFLDQQQQSDSHNDELYVGQ